MKKTVLSLCCFALSISFAIAQNAALPPAPVPAPAHQLTAAQKEELKNGKTPQQIAEAKSAKKGKDAKASKKLTPEEIGRIQKALVQKDPNSKVSVAEIQKNPAKYEPLLAQIPAPIKNAQPALANAGTPNSAQMPAAQPMQNSATPASNQAIDPDAPKFEFENGNSYNYGEILENNEPTPHEFVFTNTGKKPLVIQEAHGSCGCTVPSYSKEPVMPGQKSTIMVKYSSRGRIGPISKDVIITSNAVPSPTMLHISGTVKANPEYANPQPNPNDPNKK